MRPSVLFCAPHELFASERTWVGLTYLRSLHNSYQPGGGFEVDWTESLSDITRARIWRYNVIVLWISPDSGAVVPNPFPGPFRASFVGVILDYVAAGGGARSATTKDRQVPSASLQGVRQTSPGSPCSVAKTLPRSQLLRCGTELVSFASSA